MTLTTSSDSRPGRRARGTAGARRLAVLAATGLVTASLTATGATTATAVVTTALTSSATIKTALPAAAVGKLAPRGCTVSGTAATCDLYAMSGSTPLPGGALPIWGFSTTGTAGTATAPGPVLVVKQGDSVSITLHNQLAENVSLALPGQRGVSHPGPVGDDVIGAPAGASATYTFTATRPGTFAYEAGHTPNGSRQVAMGLAGALVVLPADGTAYGSPGTAYHDDAVLVLSEIDPKLNANPATFDMRTFAPKYRLINGKPFPSSDPVSTDQGRTVLLRYVNVGSQSHSMSLLGADQTRVAQDGHPMTYPEAEVVEAVPPGGTADTLVVMPTGPESKITLFDAAQHLDNNAQTTADPLQLAFGGMMTFLDTAAPPPSTDGVGPVSTHLTASPNPSDGLSAVTVTAVVSDASTGGSSVAQAEFVIDDAVTTGPGFGTAMTGTPGTGSVSVSGTITTAVLGALDAGRHVVYVRGLDAAGNWGAIGSVILNLPKTGPQTTGGSAAPSPANGDVSVVVSATGDDTSAGGVITDAEYFIDTVGANGAGTAVLPNRRAMVVSLDATVAAASVKALGEGPHHVFVHSKDSLGLWGPTLDVPLPVDLTGPGVDAATIGPNPSNGVLTDKANPGYLLVSAAITDKDAAGAPQNPVVDAEGFLDLAAASPAGGTGFQLVAVDGRMDNSTESVYGLVPISQVRSMTDGIHHVSVRGKDAAGNWGPLFTFELVVDKKAPVLSALTASPNPVDAGAPLTMTATVTANEPVIANAEVWVGTVDPGVGKATAATVGYLAPVAGATSGTVTVTTTVPQASGVTRFNLRVKDAAGNWSSAVNTSVTVLRGNPIFADGFNAGSLAAWSARTGAVSATAAAGIPAGTTGLQVSLPGGTGNRLSYLSDSSPTGESRYFAKFEMNANTLTSGANSATVLTLFQSRGTTGAQVFALQTRRAANVVQVRTVLSRAGAAAVIGVWVPLTSGPHTMALGWNSGPATGVGAGALDLSVDGLAVSTLAGNTTGLRTETVWLGVSAGFTNATSGVMYVDSFVSTRNTAP